MLTRRTDLALEAHSLWQAAAKESSLKGLSVSTTSCFSFSVTRVRVESDDAAKALGKPMGTYVTLDLQSLHTVQADTEDRAAQAIGRELRALLPKTVESALLVGLGNRAMTPDAIGPKCAGYVAATRHLMQHDAFQSLTSVSILTPGVLGTTGMEAAELVRSAAETIHPDVIVVVDALCSQRLSRVCTTVQLSDTGIVPGSGVGNHRSALTHETIGVPVIAVGVPTVVDAATLTMDVLEEAGITSLEPEALRGHTGVTVTLRDIDAQVDRLSRLTGFGIGLALQPSLSLSDVKALL